MGMMIPVLFLAILLVLIAVPSVILIRRSRAGRGAVGPGEEHAPRNIEREVLEQHRGWDSTRGSDASGQP